MTEAFESHLAPGVPLRRLPLPVDPAPAAQSASRLVLPEGAIQSLRFKGTRVRTLPIPDLLPKEIERFHKKIDYTDGGCALWQGCKNDAGYGTWVVLRSGRRVLLQAHRVAFKLATGIDPVGQLVRHACDQPACCAPACLSVGSHDDNMRDMTNRGRARGQHRSYDTVAERLATGMKICTGCLVRKPLQDFAMNHRARDGRTSRCKPCLAAYQRGEKPGGAR